MTVFQLSSNCRSLFWFSSRMYKQRCNLKKRVKCETTVEEPV